MEKPPFKIRLDITNGLSIKGAISVVQNDTHAYRLDLSVYNKKIPVDMSDKTATITFLKKDGNVVVGTWQYLQDNQLTYEIGTQEISLPGKVEATIEIYDGVSRLSSCKFTITVIGELDNGNSIPSTTEYKILTDLINRVGTGGSGGEASAVIWNNVLNKPNFSTVATSGRYQDLLNRPTIPTDTNQLTKTDVYTKTEVDNRISEVTGGIGEAGGDMYRSTYDTDGDGIVDRAEVADSVAWTNVTGKPSFSTVANSGNYNDLSNRPSIPAINDSVASNSTVYSALKVQQMIDSLYAIIDSYHPMYVRITTTGSSFAPLVELTSGSTATVTWEVEETGTTYTGIAPTINFGTVATRHVRLSVKKDGINALSDIVTFNIGFNNSEDQGRYRLDDIYNYSSRQNVSAIENVNYMRGLRRFLAATPTLGGSLDFTGMSNLEYIECFGANISSINLTGCTSLIRLCMEGNDLAGLDLNPVAANLYDLRASANRSPFTFTTLTSPLLHLYHYCAQNETVINHPTASQLPVIDELLDYSSGQTGTLTIRSTAARNIASSGNAWTSVDVANQFPNGRNGILDVGYNQLTSAIITNNPGLTNINFEHNSLSSAAVDGILQEVASWGTSNGVLNLLANAGPTSTGEGYVTTLRSRGWTVNIEATVSGGGTTPTNTTPTITSSYNTTSVSTTTSVSIPYSIVDSEGGTFTATYTLDGVSTTTTGLSTGNNIWNVGMLSVGSHTLTIRVADSGNLNSNTLTFNITSSVSNTAPSITSSYSTTSVTTTDSISIPYTITDSQGGTMTATYTIDSVSSTVNNLSVGANTWAVGTLTAGNHTLTIQVRDSGNLTSNTLTFNITSAAAPQSNVLWSDNFDRANATGVTAVGNGWIGDNMDANIVNNDLILTGGGGFGKLYNMASGVLPANYTISMTIPSGSKGSYFGLFGRWQSNNGVAVLFTGNDTTLVMGNPSGFPNDISVPAYTLPSSWADNTRTHTVALRFEGTSITLIIDGTNVVTVTSPINATATGTGVGFCGETQNRTRLLIEATTNS